MSLTVCFLTRDDAEFLPEAIRSLAGLADQIVVIDTFSKDDTARLAKELGAEVYQIDWADDFAAGRHAALAKANGDWILWMHAAERLVPIPREVLNACMAQDGVFGYMAIIENLVDPARPDLFSETADLRLFRRRDDLAYIGRLHPHFTPEFAKTIEEEGKQVLPGPLRLRSNASPIAANDDKLRWIARLLELELADRPGQLHYLIEQGRTLLGLDEQKGHASMIEALRIVLADRDKPNAPSAKVALLLEYVLTTKNQEVHRILDLDSARELANRWFSRDPALLWIVAAQQFNADNFQKASEALERLVELGRTGAYDRSRKFDPRLLGGQTVLNLGACHGQLGRFEQAEHCFRSLLSQPEYREAARRNLEVLDRMRPSWQSSPIMVSERGVS